MGSIKLDQNFYLSLDTKWASHDQRSYCYPKKKSLIDLSSLICSSWGCPGLFDFGFCKWFVFPILLFPFFFYWMPTHVKKKIFINHFGWLDLWMNFDDVNGRSLMADFWSWCVSFADCFWPIFDISVKAKTYFILYELFYRKHKNYKIWVSPWCCTKIFFLLFQLQNEVFLNLLHLRIQRSLSTKYIFYE